MLVADRGANGRYVSGVHGGGTGSSSVSPTRGSGAGGVAATPLVRVGQDETHPAIYATGTAGGPVSGRSMPDAGTGLGQTAPYDEVRPANGSLDQAPIVCDPVYGMPAQTQQEPAGALPSYVGREPAPVGLGAGSYALGDARDLGAPVDTPEHGLPGLLSGVYDYSARVHQLGDQAIVEGPVQAGGSYLEYQPAPYVG